MKVFEYDIDREFYFPDYINEDECVCFFDIETDGLSHTRNNIVLVGLLIYSKSRSRIVQMFCEHTNEEQTLILMLSKLLKSVDTIVTYNGSSFDIPFVKKKLLKYGVDNFFDSISHIDLYSKVRKYKVELELENCKLKTVERKLGIYREDTITGKESVMLYKEYLSNPCHSIRKTILKHNYDDIYHLPDIFKIEKFLDTRDTISLSSKHKIIKIWIEARGLKLKRNGLEIRCKSPAMDCSDVLSYEDIYTISWNKDSGDILIELSTQFGLLEDGSTAHYIYLSDLNLTDMYEQSNLCILSIDSFIQKNNVLCLISQILKNWI